MDFRLNSRSSHPVENEPYDVAIDFTGAETEPGSSSSAHGLAKKNGKTVDVLLFSQNNSPCESKQDIRDDIRRDFENFLYMEFDVEEVVYKL